MKLGIIGIGAIGSYVCERAVTQGHNIRALLLRDERLRQGVDICPNAVRVTSVEDLPDDIDLMIDCAGHGALASFGPKILRRGTDLLTVSLGALADAEVHQELQAATEEGASTLHLASGAIGALDCLRAACTGNMNSVTYIGRKPPRGWKGSAAESRLDLDALEGEARSHFDGSARDAAMQYPKNANVAAAVALSGIGFDNTRVELIADPAIDYNIHELQASGDFGSFSFEIRGQSLPDNPRSSALAAMSIVSALAEESQSIVF